MGCDIHGRIQRRYSPADPYTDEGEIESGRDYHVFAMLANVRNGYGFAGVSTHEPLVPISEPRGLPDDLEVENESIPLKEYLGENVVACDYWLGDHSHSWLTLSEILAWDGWDKPLTMTGVLDADEFQRIERDGGKPRSWSGDVCGRNVVKVSAEEARAGAKYTHVVYSWQTPFREYSKTFRAWLDYMRAKYGWLIERDPDAIRIVFGFDS